MSVSGVISVNVEFRDSTTLASVERLKTVALREATEYAGGKVAIITGTVSETPVSFDNLVSQYRDSSGNVVSFSVFSRAVVKATSGDLFVSRYDNETINKRDTAIFAGDVALLTLLNLSANSEYAHELASYSGIASYTIILYGT